MKIVCSKDPLLKAIRTAESLLLTKNINKADLVIDATSDMLKIYSTDLDTSVVIQIQASIENNGAVVVFGKKINEIISNLPNDDIQLVATEDNTMKIKTMNKETKALFTLKGLSKDDYPELPVVSNKNIFKIEQKILKNMIKKVILSASNDDTRYVLNGILLNIKKDRMLMVATDGRRLSLINSAVEGLPEEKNVIVSKKVLGEIEKMLGTEGECQLGVTENQIFFRFDNISIISRLIDGEFPDYQQVVPSSTEMEVSFNSQEMMTAVRRISVMVTENFKKLTMTMNKKNSVVFNATDPDLGDANEEIDIKNISQKLSDDFVIAFNSFFLVDVLKVIDSEEVVFQFNKNTNPAVIREKDNNNFLSVIMPMKIA